MDRAVTLFPQPDSPTMPNTPPSARLKLTRSTALATPRSVKKKVCRSSTESSTEVMKDSSSCVPFSRLPSNRYPNILVLRGSSPVEGGTTNQQYPDFLKIFQKLPEKPPVVKTAPVKGHGTWRVCVASGLMVSRACAFDTPGFSSAACLPEGPKMVTRAGIVTGCARIVIGPAAHLPCRR